MPKQPAVPEETAARRGGQHLVVGRSSATIRKGGFVRDRRTGTTTAATRSMDGAVNMSTGSAPQCGSDHLRTTTTAVRLPLSTQSIRSLSDWCDLAFNP